MRDRRISDLNIPLAKQISVDNGCARYERLL